MVLDKDEDGTNQLNEDFNTEKDTQKQRLAKTLLIDMSYFAVVRKIQSFVYICF